MRPIPVSIGPARGHVRQGFCHLFLQSLRNGAKESGYPGQVVQIVTGSVFHSVPLAICVEDALYCRARDIEGPDVMARLMQVIGFGKPFLSGSSVDPLVELDAHYRSISPSTMSRLPIAATTSATMFPATICGSDWRL